MHEVNDFHASFVLFSIVSTRVSLFHPTRLPLLAEQAQRSVPHCD